LQKGSFIKKLTKTIIHIGFPRTASSWFQKNLFPNVKNYTLVEREKVHNAFIHPSSLLFNPSQFLSELPGNNLIISEEMVTGRIRSGLVNHLFFKEFIDRSLLCFPDATFVVFLRNQLDSIYSQYKLFVEKGGTYSLNKFLSQGSKLKELMLFSPDFFEYSSYLNFLSGKVAESKIKVYLFEDFHSAPKAFTEKLCKDLNLQTDPGQVNFDAVNSSLNQHRILIFRLLNHFSRYGEPFKHYYFHLAGIERLKSFLLKRGNSANNSIPAEVFNLAPNYKQGNQDIMRKYRLPQMVDYNYPLP
jgi:hypothetical protein